MYGRLLYESKKCVFRQRLLNVDSARGGRSDVLMFPDVAEERYDDGEQVRRSNGIRVVLATNDRTLAGHNSRLHPTRHGSSAADPSSLDCRRYPVCPPTQPEVVVSRDPRRRRYHRLSQQLVRFRRRY